MKFLKAILDTFKSPSNLKNRGFKPYSNTPSNPVQTPFKHLARHSPIPPRRVRTPLGRGAHASNEGQSDDR